MRFTACYEKTESDDGLTYTGRLLEWPEVITFGKDLEDCRNMVKDAAQLMALSYRDDKREIPHAEIIIESMDIPLDSESLNAYERETVSILAHLQELGALDEDGAFVEGYEDRIKSCTEALLEHVS